MSKQSLAEYVNQIQAAGRYTFTTAEAQEAAELNRDAMKGCRTICRRRGGETPCTNAIECIVYAHILHQNRHT